MATKRRQLQAPVGWLRRPSVELAYRNLVTCARASTGSQSKAHQTATRLPETTPASDDLRGHHHQIHRVSVTACKLGATQRAALQLPPRRAASERAKIPMISRAEGGLLHARVGWPFKRALVLCSIRKRYTADPELCNKAFKSTALLGCPNERCSSILPLLMSVFVGSNHSGLVRVLEWRTSLTQTNLAEWHAVNGHSCR